MAKVANVVSLHQVIQTMQVHEGALKILHPRRPKGSLENFRRAFSLDPTDCPWVSEDEGSCDSQVIFREFLRLIF